MVDSKTGFRTFPASAAMGKREALGAHVERRRPSTRRGKEICLPRDGQPVSARLVRPPDLRAAITLIADT